MPCLLQPRDLNKVDTASPFGVGFDQLDSSPKKHSKLQWPVATWPFFDTLLPKLIPCIDYSRTLGSWLT